MQGIKIIYIFAKQYYLAQDNSIENKIHVKN